MTGLQRREALWGWAFVAPWVLGFVVFWAVPILASFAFSLFDFQLSQPEATSFVGGENWQRALSDPDTWQALAVTFRFTLLFLPISLVFAFAIALLLNSKHLLGRNLFRTLFYAPTMVPLIAAILIWSQVLNPQTGWVNQLLDLVPGLQASGVSGIRWFDNPVLVLFAYSFIGLWGVGNAVLINLAGLQGVPTELYEAASIDGAGWLRRLWHVTLPMISPVVFYNLIIGLVQLMQFFTVPWVLNGGNGYPDGSTRFLMIHFYKHAFTFTNMGYGATLAWIIFLVAGGATLLLFGTARYWVHYSGERA
jgi:ABC-type sugar transport system permease subunit